MARNYPTRIRIADTAQSRVTSTPAALGNYRSYLKSANSAAGVDGAPGTAPTSADGFKITSFDYATLATDATRYEIFVGANKVVSFEFYSGTGRTGYLSTDWCTFPNGGTSDAVQIGTQCGYDPTTGVAWIDTQRQTNTCTSRYVGTAFGTAGAAATNASAAYFDVIVTGA